MIFVTVGTHEQQFNRLIMEIDELKVNKIIKDDIFIQTGYSDYKPKYCDYKEMISYDEMNKKMKQARIIITHGGPSTILLSLQNNKIPIVVPRQKRYNEHVNDHQLEFIKEIKLKMDNIIPIYDIDKLKEVIANYNNIIKDTNIKMNNNKLFCEKFEQQLDDLLSR